MSMETTVAQEPVGRLSAELSAELLSIERMVVGAGKAAAGALRRAHGRAIDGEQYGLMVGWVGYMIIQQGLQHTTAQNYLDAIGEWLVQLNREEVAVGDAVGMDLENWNKSLYLLGAQHSRTRNGKLTAVRQFYKWRELQGMGMNPMGSVRSPKIDKKMPRKYSDAQLKALFTACDRETPMGKRDYAILLMFYATGARRMEVASLRLDQLTVQQRVARVKFEGKGCKERVVSFEGEAVKALGEWLMERDRYEVMDLDAVFIGLTGRNKGGRLGENGLDDVLYRAVRKSRIHVESGMALHTLRVNFATDLYDLGEDIETLRFLMGHEEIETTRRYIAISDRRQRTRMPSSRLGELTGGKRSGPPMWFEQQQRGLFPKDGEDV